MPLKAGSSKKIISQNVSEFHKGPTYAHTLAKFGKKRANAQAVAAALNTARKYQAGGEVEEPSQDRLMKTAEGFPFVQAGETIQPPGSGLVSLGRRALESMRSAWESPSPIKGDGAAEPYFAAEPSQEIYGAGKKIGQSIVDHYGDLLDPFSKDESGRYVADQPIPETESGKVPQATKDIGALGLPAAAEVIGTLGGVPGKGALWPIGKTLATGAIGAAVRRTGRQLTVEEELAKLLSDLSPATGGPAKDALAKAEMKVQAALAEPGRFTPEIIAENLTIANRSNPETIAFDLFQMAQHNPRLANRVFEAMPPQWQADIDNYIGEYSNAAGIYPFKALKKESGADELAGAKAEAIKTNDVERLNFLRDLARARPRNQPAQRVMPPALEAQYPWTRTFRSVLPNLEPLDSGAIQFLDKNILPHYNGNMNNFVREFFNGLYTPNNFGFSSGDNGIQMTGRFQMEGGGGGSIDRSIQIAPDGKKYAYHGYLQLPRSKQGSGFAKDLLRKQVDLYQKMGLDYVKLSANIDVGAYSWARYGFLPSTDEAWRELSDSLFNTIQDLVRTGSIPGQIAEDLLTIVEKKDKKALWDFVDYPAKIPIGMYGSTFERPLKWSQALIMNRSWPGRLDLKDSIAMERFNAYIKRGK